MTISYLKTLGLICAVGTMTLTSTLSAQQNETQLKTQPQQSQQSELNDHSEMCITELSKAVDLKPDQETKIHDIYLQSQVAQKATWQKYNQAQMSAIHIEAEMCSAMEARMTDSQKQTFTSARISQQEKMAEGTTSQKIRETPGRRDNTPAKTGDRSDRTQTGNSEKPTQNQGEETLTPSESFVQTSIIAPMEQVVVSLGMDRGQSAKCKSTCHAYHTKLNSAWTEINSLRNELVTQEAKTIKAVAKVLTKEQNSKLEKHRALALKTDDSSSSFSR